MYKTIKNIAFLIAITITFSLTSCVDEPLETEVRTAEMEQAELQQLFDQVEANELVLDSTDLGVYFLVDSMGSGPLVQPGDTCFIKYIGQFLNGVVFDDSRNHPANPEGVWEIIYIDPDPQKRLISGFENGIGLMNKGARLDLIIPSELAYGNSGAMSPFTPLLFSVEMIDIKPVIEP